MNFLPTIPAHYKTVLSAYFSRIITIVCKIVTVPLLLTHLDGAEYAALVVITGLEGWFLLFDFGMGYSVQNTIAESGLNKEEESSTLKTALIYSLGSILLAGFFIYGCSSFFSSFLLGKMNLGERGRELFLLSSLFLLLGSFGSIGGRILAGRNKAYLVHLTQAGAHLLSLFCILGYCLKGNLSLQSAILVGIGIPSVVSLSVAIVVFSKTKFTGKIDLKVISRAKNFWFFALSASFVSLSDCFVISRTLSVQEIIEYNLLCKIFGIASFAYGAVVQGLMPDCSRNMFLKNTKEVRRTVYKHCTASIWGVVVFTTAVSMFSPLSESFFSLSLGIFGIIAFGFYLCTRVIGDFYSMALQSHSVLVPFFYLVPVQAAVSLFLQYFLSLKIGVAGIPIGMAVSYAVTVCLVLPNRLRKLESS